MPMKQHYTAAYDAELGEKRGASADHRASTIFVCRPTGQRSAPSVNSSVPKRRERELITKSSRANNPLNDGADMQPLPRWQSGAAFV